METMTEELDMRPATKGEEIAAAAIIVGTITVLTLAVYGGVVLIAETTGAIKRSIKNAKALRSNEIFEK